MVQIKKIAISKYKEMSRTLSLLFLFMIGSMLKAQNMLKVDDVMLPQNGEATIKVNYKFNTGKDKYNAYSFNLVLPDGLYFEQEDDGNVICLVGNCHDSSYSVLTNLRDGKLKVAGFSLSGKPLKGAEDLLLTFTVKSSGNLEIGDNLTGRIENALIVPTEGEKEKLANSEFPITIVDGGGSF